MAIDCDSNSRSSNGSRRTISARESKRSSHRKANTSATGDSEADSPKVESTSTGNTHPELLESNVLVLNRFYMALRVVSVRRALTLLYRNCSEVIVLEQNSYASYDIESWQEISQLASLEKQPEDDFLQAVGFELLVPRVIRLTRFDRMPMQSVRFNRRNVFARDGHVCQYCGEEKPTNQLSLDHVVPRAHGGQTTWENIVCCCLHCNSRKGGRTPKQARMQLLTSPQKPRVNPLLMQPIIDPRYECWKTFLPPAG